MVPLPSPSRPTKQSGAVDIAAMTDLHDHADQFTVVDLGYDSVGPNRELREIVTDTLLQFDGGLQTKRLMGIFIQIHRCLAHVGSMALDGKPSRHARRGPGPSRVKSGCR